MHYLHWGFIRPKADSVTWLKVNDLGLWSNHGSCGSPSACRAPDPCLKIILLPLRACKTMGPWLTLTDSPSLLQCVSNRLILAHEGWREPAERSPRERTIPYTHNTDSHRSKDTHKTVDAQFIPVVPCLVSSPSTPLVECGKAMLNGFCRGKDLKLS